MASIPQRDLRNDVGGVLRRAESGERLVITVSGRAVAELGPVRPSKFVSGAHAREALAGIPRPRGLLDDVRTAGGGAIDPWA